MEGILLLKKRRREVEQEEEEYYVFNSRRCPPKMDELKSLEDMEKLIRNIQFRRPRDNFQSTLQRDAAYSRGSRDIFVQADKTKTIYKMERAQYKRLLHENVTKHYKVAEKTHAIILIRRRGSLLVSSVLPTG